MAKKNAFYAQSGGVTAVINASACGVIEACREHRDKIGTLYAGQNGIIGALHENLIDTSKETAASIKALKHTPGGAFGSCRYKMKDLKESTLEYERLVEVFRAHNIGYFFYNGGGDSADTCLKVSQISAKMGYPIQAIHIPKTIDNDLPFTDCSPGFGSVAKYVAVSTKEASLDIASMAASSTKIFILEVMGRHAGWIAASGGLAASEAGDAPHIIVFPEIPFVREEFIAKVQQTVAEKGYCVVVASEGASYADGALISGSLNKDAFGHQQLGGVAPTLASMVKHSLGYKYHYALADYLQRSARHVASKTDVEQAYAVGRAAVDKAVAGKTGIMVTIERGKGKTFSWTLGEASLAKVANVEKKMPRSFITKDGFGITQKARDYLQPLIMGEDYPPYKNGIPLYPKLKIVLAPKKLDTEFNG
ncbi:6-phosphofructokinase [SAR92 clade bacterium H231]|jgi:6-phosphofructokinase|nr:6-phosphofructokinase [Porticoccaceae bacterium]MCT2532784.1 6-phosphofructokinase [SAR92 clade bacterium H231]MBT6320492.1 6-phosphofructokinase [Porticoccaceae bacterium]MBT7903914.1 6-phosphofructokinase [Porticoccaceae bacterium]MDA9839669.1 6-phosphofructokinase [Porticoccaceae bacterium]